MSRFDETPEEAKAIEYLSGKPVIDPPKPPTDVFLRAAVTVGVCLLGGIFVLFLYLCFQ